MIPYVVAAVVGATLMGRTKPNAAVTKTTCFGPRSGLTYAVDMLDGLEVFVVSAADGTRAVFERGDGGTMVFVKARGVEETVDLMRQDFEAGGSDAGKR